MTNNNSGSRDPIPLETAERMLSFVRGVDDRDTWVKMAYVLRDEYGDVAFDVWDQWSQGSQSYNVRAARSVWKSCGKPSGKGRAGIGTLVALAKEGGWKPSQQDRRVITPEERQRIADERAARMERERIEAEEERAEAARVAADMLARAKPAVANAYTQRKSITPVGAYMLDGELLIPVQQGPKQICGVQRILPDGGKFFIKGTQAQGGYMVLGRPTKSGPVVICEGWATGVSVHMATGWCVVVAFNAGNLLEVSRKIRAALPEAVIHIAADDDFLTAGNPGITAAIAAATEVSATIAVPLWAGDRGDGTDFNDLHVSEGLDAVRMCFEDPKPLEDFSESNEDIGSDFTPTVHQETVPVASPSASSSVQILPAVSDQLAPECSDDDLAARHLDRMQQNTLWCEMWGRWLVWNGDRWLKDETNLVLDVVRQSCRLAANDVLANPELDPGKRQRQADKIASYRTITNVERLARTYRMVATHPDEWDQDRWLLNTPGGVVDLRSGQLRPHSREDRFTKITGVAPGGECPTWLQFLERATGGNRDLQAFLKRMCGYALTGEVREHALFFVYGTGGNGKGTFLNTITHIMGDYQRVAAAETFTESNGDRHTTELARLQGARLVTAQETEEGKRWAESRIKALTGGDPITARYMRQDDFTFLPQFKLVIVGNHKPSFRSVDEAIKRRLHLIPFTAEIPASEKDPMLAEKLKAEAPAILQWMIEGCLEWERNGLKPPEIVKESTEQYLGDEDSLQQWLDDCCDLSKGGFTTSKALFYSWSKWCEQSGEYVGTMKRLMAKLESRGISTGQKFKGARGCIGIKIKQDDHEYESKPF